MKRLLALMLAALPAWAQFTTVTGTVHDPNGCAFGGGSGRAQIVPTNQTYSINGSSFQTVVTIATLTANGSFSMVLADNTQVLPANSQWAFSFCGQGGQNCFAGPTLTISGSSQSITSSITPLAPVLNCAGSFGLVMPVEFIVTPGNPIVVTKALENAGTFWAGPIPGGNQGNWALPGPLSPAPPIFASKFKKPHFARGLYGSMTSTLLFQSGPAVPTFRAIDKNDEPFTFPISGLNGGTGQSTLTANGVVYAANSSTMAEVTGSTHQVLHAITSSAPTFSAVALTTDVSGTLPTANGGTGVTDLTFSGSTHVAATTTGTLTNNRCVQIDASGNFVQAAAACATAGPSQIETQIFGATCSATTVTPCNTIYTWTTPFADAGYVPVCWGGGFNSIPVISINSQNAATINVEVTSANGTSFFNNVYCIGIHP